MGAEYLASAGLRNPDRPFHTTLDMLPVISMEGEWRCIKFRLSYCCGAEMDNTETWFTTRRIQTLV
jgi:hypothetical protein